MKRDSPIRIPVNILCQRSADKMQSHSDAADSGENSQWNSNRTYHNRFLPHGSSQLPFCRSYGRQQTKLRRPLP